MADIRDRITDLRRARAGDLVPNPKNWRRHSPAQQKHLQAVLAEVGWADALIGSETDQGIELLDGPLRAGLDPEAIVPVLVVDLDEAEADVVLATLDPLAAMAEADKGDLTALLESIQRPDLSAMLDDIRKQQHLPIEHGGAPDPGPQLDQAAELLAKWGTERGQLWEVGVHRLMCGDCTSPEDRRKLYGGVAPNFIMTDPPYSSGGFQEASRASGSIGTVQQGQPVPQIVNDRLSTHGYLALIKRAIGEIECAGAYVFTDWKMWVNLYDVMESSGFGVRQMIVWDKGSPGMGVGWRSQHEIIMFACRNIIKFDNHKALGNVIRCQRTGNPNHPTEKPVELLAAILNITDAAQTLYDPFLGSGTTMVACEQTERICYGMEIEPKYVAVTLERMAGMGLEPRRVE